MACSSGSSASRHAITSTSAVPLTSPATDAPNTSSTTTPRLGTSNPTDLGDRILPTPDGYEVSTDSNAHTGPVAPADFDKEAGSPGVSRRLGFTAGYEATYDAVDTSESLDVSILQFSSPAQATAFLPIAIASGSDDNKDELPRQRAYGPIEGATEIDATTATSDGFYDYVVIVAKGPRMMIFDYSNDHASGFSSSAAGQVLDQYNRI
jgi:hypothetical protein